MWEFEERCIVLYTQVRWREGHCLPFLGFNPKELANHSRLFKSERWLVTLIAVKESGWVTVFLLLNYDKLIFVSDFLRTSSEFLQTIKQCVHQYKEIIGYPLSRVFIHLLQRNRRFFLEEAEDDSASKMVICVTLFNCSRKREV